MNRFTNFIVVYTIMEYNETLITDPRQQGAGFSALSKYRKQLLMACIIYSDYMYWHCTTAHKCLQSYRFIMQTYTSPEFVNNENECIFTKEDVASSSFDFHGNQSDTPLLICCNLDLRKLYITKTSV